MIAFILILFSMFLVQTSADQLILNKSKSILQSCTKYGTNNNQIIVMINCNNNQYISQINIGTTIQTFTVLFDTGSNILWVPIQNCVPNPCTFPQFDLSKSTTAVVTSQTMSLQYADGSGVEGNYGSDIINFAGTTINITTGILWVNQQVSMDIPSNGIVGLGFDTEYPNFFDSAYAAGQIATNIFSFELELTASQSAVYFNQIPSSILNNTYYIDQYETGHWQVETIGFYANNEDLTSFSSSIAIIDTGTSAFYVNQNLYEALSIAFFSQCSVNNQGFFSCPCSIIFPKFQIMFIGISVFIYPENYTTNNTGICTAQFGTLGDVNNILLGDTFFRNYIVTFDKNNKKIGFKGNLGVIHLIGEDSTYLFYIGQIICVSFGGIILIFSLVVLISTYAKGKGPNKNLNVFLLQMG